MLPFNQSIYTANQILLKRYVLERFFSAAFEAMVRNETITSLVKEKSSEYLNLFDVKKSSGISTPKLNPKMSNINKMLECEEIQLAIWDELEIPRAIKLPKFPLSILYGRISEMLHLPDIRLLYISDKADQGFKTFLNYIAIFSDNIPIEEYSEDEAAAARAETDIESDDDLIDNSPSIFSGIGL